MDGVRKRQRKQAAALVVQSFFDMGKKSTAQLRPEISVPPRGIGPIGDPNENDVLCGRGGRINAHEGNIRFRDIISTNKRVYLAKATKKLEKAHIAKKIVDHIRNMNPPGRFLKQDSSDGLWWDIGDQKAIKKVGQALREDAPGIRDEKGHDSSGDEEGEDSKPKATDSPINVGGLQSSIDTGQSYGSASVAYVQSDAVWSAGGPTCAATGEQAPAHIPYPGRHPAPSSHAHYHYGPPNNPYHGTSSNMYNVPTQFFNGLQPANRSGKLSQMASEAMRLASPIRTTSDGPQVAFGRVFTPTVMSSGSTMSSISGLSSGMGTESLVQSGSSWQRKGSTQHKPSSLRVSQISDMTNSFMSLGSSLGLTRSSSLPDLGVSMRDGTSLSDASFAALMEEGTSEVLNAGIGSDLRNSSGTSGSSGNRPPAPQPRTRTTSHTSAASAMSWASGGSQRSIVSSSMRSSTGSDTSWLLPYKAKMAEWNDDSSRSVMSDVSADVLALDLAQPKM